MAPAQYTHPFGEPKAAARISGLLAAESVGAKPRSTTNLRSQTGGLLRASIVMTNHQQRTVNVYWSPVTPNHDDWSATRCLYAYIAPNELEILYIGMTWDQTFGTRSNYSAKPLFWDYLEYERDLNQHIALVGHIELAAPQRLSKALLFDIESLLIFRVEPCGNIQAISTRTSRPGMEIECIGEAWPGPQYLVDNL